jgi:hypothetical protein
MNSPAKSRTARGWDIGLAAGIVAVVLLGWLTAPGSTARTVRYAPAARIVQRPPGPPRSMKGTPR